MPTMQDLYDEWTQNPDRLLLAIDETRRDAPNGHGQFIVFTCVAFSVTVANDLLNAMEEAREQLPPAVRNNSFKSKKLFREKPPKMFEKVAGVVLEGLRNATSIDRVITTSRNVSASTTNVELLTPAGQRFAGPELAPSLHLAKYVGMKTQPAPDQIDLLLDRSRQMGLDPRQAGIEATQFNVLGPGHLNRSPGGGSTALICHSSFKIIAGSDELLHLRDLLLLPDAAGYVGMFKTDMSAVEREILAGRDLLIMSADLALMRNSLTQPSQASPSADEVPAAGDPPSAVTGRGGDAD